MKILYIEIQNTTNYFCLNTGLFYSDYWKKWTRDPDFSPIGRVINILKYE